MGLWCLNKSIRKWSVCELVTLAPLQECSPFLSVALPTALFALADFSVPSLVFLLVTWSFLLVTWSLQACSILVLGGLDLCGDSAATTDLAVAFSVISGVRPKEQNNVMAINLHWSQVYGSEDVITWGGSWSRWKIYHRELQTITLFTALLQENPRLIRLDTGECYTYRKGLTHKYFKVPLDPYDQCNTLPVLAHTCCTSLS